MVKQGLEKNKVGRYLVSPITPFLTPIPPIRGYGIMTGGMGSWLQDWDLGWADVLNYPFPSDNYLWLLLVVITPLLDEFIAWYNIPHFILQVLTSRCPFWAFICLINNTLLTPFCQLFPNYSAVNMSQVCFQRELMEEYVSIFYFGGMEVKWSIFLGFFSKNFQFFQILLYYI